MIHVGLPIKRKRLAVDLRLANRLRNPTTHTEPSHN